MEATEINPLEEALYDFVEPIEMRGLHTGLEYLLTAVFPYLGEGYAEVLDSHGNKYTECIDDVLDCMVLAEPANDPDDVGEFMVSVDGGKAPKHIHTTRTSAFGEAVRLAEELPGRKVRVLEVDIVLIGKPVVEVHECQ